MRLPATIRQKAIYGEAFPLPELAFMRDGAARRGLRMTILLDQVLDGAEFEEVVLIRPSFRPHRAVTVWRTATCIVAQAAGGQPKAFGGIRAAMDHVFASLPCAAPSRRRFSWRTLFAWAESNVVIGCVSTTIKLLVKTKARA